MPTQFMKTIRRACCCGATLVVVNLPHRADWQLECFLTHHQAADGCEETDYMTAVQQRHLNEQALARAAAGREEPS